MCQTPEDTLNLSKKSLGNTGYKENELHYKTSIFCRKMSIKYKILMFYLTSQKLDDRIKNEIENIIKLQKDDYVSAELEMDSDDFSYHIN